MNKEEEEEEDYQRLVDEAWTAYEHNVVCFVEGILIGILVGVLLMIAWMI